MEHSLNSTPLHVLAFDIGIKNLSFIELAFQSSDMQVSILQWGIIDISKDDKGNDINTKDYGCLATTLLTKLHSLFFGKHYTYIIVENQPVLQNPVMKSIQVAVHTYFLNAKLFYNTTMYSKLSFVNAANKLKPSYFVPKDIADMILGSQTVKGAYAKRKKASIAYAEYFLTKSNKCSNSDTWMKVFSSHKKKDDLSDALNMALHYISALQII